MSFSALGALTRRLGSFLAQSGSFVSSGHGMPHRHHEPIEIAIGAMLGALAGFVAGLLLAKIARFVAFSLGRDLATGRWMIYGTVVGAIAGALWEMFAD
jgi:hypothetical protein